MIDEQVRRSLISVFPPDVELVHAHDNGPRPAARYVTVRIEARAHRMPGIVGKQDAEGYVPTDAHRSGSVELQAFGVGSFDLLDEAMQRLDQQGAISAADEQGVVFGNTVDVQDIPVLRNQSEWEPRAVATVPFAYTRRTLEDLSWIETVHGVIDADGATRFPLPDAPFTATIVE